jgi:hypothetical protein
MNNKRERGVFLQLLLDFLMVLIGGDIAPIGCVLGIGLSMIGFISLSAASQSGYIVLSAACALLGLVILFFRIRRDMADIRNDG